MKKSAVLRLTMVLLASLLAPQLLLAESLEVYQGQDKLFEQGVAPGKIVKELSLVVSPISASRGQRVALIGKDSKIETKVSKVDSTGIVKFSDVAPGSYNLSYLDECSKYYPDLVTLASKSPGANTLVIKDQSEERILASSKEANTKGNSVLVKIYRSKGENKAVPASNVEVRLVSLEDQESIRKTSSRKGIVTFSNVLPGEYRVELNGCLGLLAAINNSSNIQFVAAPVVANSALAGATLLSATSLAGVATAESSSRSGSGGSTSVGDRLDPKGPHLPQPQPPSPN